MHSVASGSQVQEFYDTFKLFDEDKDDRLSLKDKLESSRQICATLFPVDNFQLGTQRC